MIIYPGNLKDGVTGTISGDKIALDVNDVGSSGGSSGGGNNSYSNASGDFTATANSGAKTITFTGLPFTLEAKHLVLGSIKRINSSNEVDELPLTDVAVSAGVVTLADMSANFASGDTVVVSLVGPDKAYDQANDAALNSIINPGWSRSRGDTLVDVTNETNATNFYYIDMEGYDGLTIQFEKTGGTDTVTLTVEGTLQDDGTAASSCVYQDITQHGMTVQSQAATAASYTADVITSLEEGSHYKFVAVKTVSSGGANDADFAVYIKKIKK